MKKDTIIGIAIGIVIGLSVGIMISKGINTEKKEKSTLNQYDQKFIGRWEYGTKYEEMESKLEVILNNYNEKYELKTGQRGCVYTDDKNNSFMVSGQENNVTLLINKDGTVEYTAYLGKINDNCEVQIYADKHYKGTFENSKIIFKEYESNNEWKEIRLTHNIYLEDSETLHYKESDENPNSYTYLFIKRE